MDVHNSYNSSPENVRLAKIRLERKQQLTQEYIKKLYDPHKQAQGTGGTPFDPAMQRFISMRSSANEYFKPNFKAAFKGLALFVVPVVVLSVFFQKRRNEFLRKCSTGEISYRERSFKFV